METTGTSGRKRGMGLLPIESKLGLEAGADYNTPVPSKSLPAEQMQPAPVLGSNTATDNPFLSRLNPLASSMKDKFKDRLKNRLGDPNAR